MPTLILKLVTYHAGESATQVSRLPNIPDKTTNYRCLDA